MEWDSLDESEVEAEIEQQGKIRTTIKLEGAQQGKDGREWLPFTLRMYFYQHHTRSSGLSQDIRKLPES